MPNFTTAAELVAYRCFVQCVDEGGVTTWEIVDRFMAGTEIVASVENESEARERVAALRQQRLAEVNRNPSKYRTVV